MSLIYPDKMALSSRSFHPLHLSLIPKALLSYRGIYFVMYNYGDGYVFPGNKSAGYKQNISVIFLKAGSTYF
jgi:hypothetical protein